MAWRPCITGTRKVALHTPRGHHSHRLLGLGMVCSHRASGQGLLMAHSHGIQLPAKALCGRGAPAPALEALEGFTLALDLHKHHSFSGHLKGTAGLSLLLPLLTGDVSPYCPLCTLVPPALG